jgi:N6-adenosine-specific RNA methylase IME4
VYQVIYADPPGRTATGKRAAATVPVPRRISDPDPPDVASIPVPTLVTRPATLWLWATVPLMSEILPVVETWGFEYKTALFWRKTGRKGIGYWFRGEVEVLLFGVCGKVRAFRSSLSNVIDAPVEGHSRKPAMVRDLIERYTPNQRREELFARGPSTDAWTCHGFESDGIDLRNPFAVASDSQMTGSPAAPCAAAGCTSAVMLTAAGARSSMPAPPTTTKAPRSARTSSSGRWRNSIARSWPRSPRTCSAPS